MAWRLLLLQWTQSTFHTSLPSKLSNALLWLRHNSYIMLYPLTCHCTDNKCSVTAVQFTSPSQPHLDRLWHWRSYDDIAHRVFECWIWLYHVCNDLMTKDSYLTHFCLIRNIYQFFISATMTLCTHRDILNILDSDPALYAIKRTFARLRRNWQANLASLSETWRKVVIAHSSTFWVPSLHCAA